MDVVSKVVLGLVRWKVGDVVTYTHLDSPVCLICSCSFERIRVRSP
jgi:hypothetical protein